MNIASPNKYLDVLGQLNLDELNIQQAFEHYRQRYQLSELAQEFVNQCGSIDADLKCCTGIGYCDRTMGKQIPKARNCEGGRIRGSLLRSGLIRATGHELFRGCVVFPTYHENGNVLSAVGYRVGRIRRNGSAVIYWHRPEPKAYVETGMSLAKELIREQTYH